MKKKATLESIEKLLIGVSKKVNSHDQRFDSLSIELRSEFKSEIGRLDANIEGLGEVMVNRFDDVDNHLDGIENRLDKVVEDVRVVSMHVGLDLSKTR